MEEVRLKTTTDEEKANPLNQVGLTEHLSLLRAKLFHKAKTEPKFRFYSMYGHVMKMETLESAWRRVRANKGKPGVDRISFADIEKREGGVHELLTNIQKSLKERTYRSDPVRRVYIPKQDGRKRPLGIPTIKDRVVQMAVLLIIEPIFEADFLDSSYGFRPGRSAHDAVAAIRSHLKEGKRTVYDADLKGYFDTIPHDNLMKAVERRIADRSVLKLLRIWLKSTIVDIDDNGKPKWYRSQVGTPQGGVISPLLANIYLHHFENYFHSLTGRGKKIAASIVRYADDFVILMQEPMNDMIHHVEHLLETRFKLKINREKTKWVDLRKAGSTLDFLGFSFRYERGIHYKGYQCLSIFPSKKSVKNLKLNIHEQLSRKNSHKHLWQIASQLNRMLGGWDNYFKVSFRDKAYREVNEYLRLKLWKFETSKSQRKKKLPEGVTWNSYLKRRGVNFLSYV
jgi:RNA-directed DNA polymerase